MPVTHSKKVGTEACLPLGNRPGLDNQEHRENSWWASLVFRL